MKTINLLIILLSLLSCESKSQEKIAITKLSQEDKNTVVKLLKDSNFEIESIKKIDSSQNVKTVSHYNNNYSQYEKKIYTYDKKNRIEIEKNYVITPLNREFLELMYETKYSYAGKNIIAETIMWRNNMQYGKSENKKIFDEEGKIIEEISESKSDEYEKIITQKKTYKYNIDKAKNKAIVCIEEYQSYATPKTFETCNTYHYESGKITKQAPETTTNKTEKTITENPLYQVRGSAFDLGSKYLILYKGFEEYPKIVVHEILHCLELRHSFDDDAKHMFKPYETENFMDYVYGEENDNRKQLWKWQWQIIWNYIDNQH